RRPKSPLSMVATDSKTPSSTSTAVICGIHIPVVSGTWATRRDGAGATGRHDFRGPRYDLGLRSKRPDRAPRPYGRLPAPAATTEDRQSDLSATPVRVHRPPARLSGKTRRGTGVARARPSGGVRTVRPGPRSDGADFPETPTTRVPPETTNPRPGARAGIPRDPCERSGSA